MKRRSWAVLGLLCSAPLLAATQNATPIDGEESPVQHAQLEASHRYLSDVALTLSRSPEPRRLIAAAQFIAHLDRFWPEHSGPVPASSSLRLSVDALVSDALRLGSDDPLLWWIVATDCPASPAVCNAPRALTRLRQIDSDNAAVWL